MDFLYYTQYFSLLEDRLKISKKFIAFEEDNLDTYSIEYASIVNDCCGLINGFMFELCHDKFPNRQHFEIRDYKEYLLDENFQISELIYCDKFIIQPWEKLVTIRQPIKDSSPNWWDAYNSIKHSGKANFKKATLKTAISCLAGMFSLLAMYDYKKLGDTICNWHGLFATAGNYKKFTSWEC